jgi:hypothetical protein
MTCGAATRPSGSQEAHVPSGDALDGTVRREPMIPLGTQLWPIAGTRASIDADLSGLRSPRVGVRCRDSERASRSDHRLTAAARLECGPPIEALSWMSSLPAADDG